MSDALKPRDPPQWPACTAEEECRGIRIEDADRCLAHADKQTRVAFLEGLGAGKPLNLNGTTITPLLLEAILGAAPRGASGMPELRDVRLVEAQFIGDALFRRARFVGVSWFSQATFIGKLFLDWAPV